MAEKQLNEATEEEYNLAYTNWDMANRIFINRCDDFIKSAYGKDIMNFIIPPYKKSDNE